MPSFELLTTIIAGIGSILISVVTFASNRRSATNKLFSIFSLSVVAYLVFNYFSLHQVTNIATFYWVKMIMSCALVINLLFYLLTVTYPGEKIQIKRLTLIILTLITLGLVIASQSNLIFSSVISDQTGTHSVPGLAMPLFLIHTIVLLGSGFFQLIKKLKTTSGIEKQQIKMLLIATILMFISILVTNLIFVLVLDSIIFVGLLPLYTLVFLTIVSYSIIRHELFNIKVIATQALIIIIWVVLFAKIFTSSSLNESIIDILVFVPVFILGILLVKSVIREVKQRQELEELTQKLQELDKQKDEFISMAAHELRSPLTAIKGYLSMILEGDAGEITTKAREFLTDTSSVTERLIRLVNNMLNVSRIEEGRMVYQMEEESVIKVAEETYNVFRFEADHRGLEFKLEVPDGLRHIVYVDPDKLREILGNLVSNALKYTNQGSVTIKLSNPTPATVKTEVIDTGPGITVEEQNKLFQKFYRAESTAGKTVGTGLGLYITRLLIEKFSGRIELSSEPGKGSNFWFEIPVYNQGSEKNV